VIFWLLFTRDKSVVLTIRIAMLVKVEVRYFAMLREIAGKRGETVSLLPNSSVMDLINLLVERYSDEFKGYIYDAENQVRNYLSYLLNGFNVNSLDGFDTKLNDGDQLSLLPPVSGG
jgi:molybdopterin synthase sulfur carrier subunit